MTIFIKLWISYSHVVVDDSGEDPLHGLVVERHDADDVEVPEEAGRDGVTPSPGGSHGRQVLDIDQGDLSCVLLIIPLCEWNTKTVTHSWI